MDKRLKQQPQLRGQGPKDPGEAGLVPEWIWTVGERKLPRVTENSVLRA